MREEKGEKRKKKGIFLLGAVVPAGARDYTLHHITTTVAPF